MACRLEAPTKMIVDISTNISLTSQDSWVSLRVLARRVLWSEGDELMITLGVSNHQPNCSSIGFKPHNTRMVLFRQYPFHKMPFMRLKGTDPTANGGQGSFSFLFTIQLHFLSRGSLMTIGQEETRWWNTMDKAPSRTQAEPTQQASPILRPASKEKAKEQASTRSHRQTGARENLRRSPWTDLCQSAQPTLGSRNSCKVKALCKTWSGDVLVELGPGTTSISKAQFGEALHSILKCFGDSATMRWI